MFFAILIAYFGHKKGIRSGRNGILWRFIALAGFIVSQLAVGLFIGVGLGIGIAVLGWPETVFDDSDIFLLLVAIIAGIIGGYLVLKYLDRIPPDHSYDSPPPPSFRG